MILEIGVLLKEGTIEESLEKLYKYVEAFEENKDYQLMDFKQNIVKTISGEDSTVVPVKDINPLSNISEEKLLMDYEFKINSKKGRFYERFSSFEEYSDLAKYFYLPILILPTGEIKNMKSYYSKKWIKTFKKKYLDKYQDCYFAHVTAKNKLPEHVYFSKGMFVSKKGVRDLMDCMHTDKQVTEYHSNIDLREHNTNQVKESV